MTLRDVVCHHLNEGRPERAFDAAAKVRHSGGAEQRYYARQLLTSLTNRVPEAAWIPIRAQEARSAGASRRSPTPEVGRMAFPVVAGDSGCFLEVRASLSSTDEWPERLGEVARRAGEVALEAVRRLVPGLHVRVHVPLEPDWDGPSWGLALALAALSAHHQVPVSDRMTATGQITSDGEIRPVSGKAEKVAMHREARPRAVMLVPTDWTDLVHPNLRRLSLLKKAWELCAPGQRDLTAAMTQIKTDDQQGRWDQAAAGAQSLLDEEALDDAERGYLIVLLLQDANHRGDKAAQAHWTERILALDANGIGEIVAARALGSRVVSCIDGLDEPAARRVLEVASARQWQAPSLPHLNGPRASWLTLTGEHDRAAALRRSTAEIDDEGERARCLGDLAEATRRLGNAELALATVRDALATANSSHRRNGYQRLTKAYLRLYEARCLRALGNPDEALEALAEAGGTPGIDPHVRIRLLEAEIREDLPMMDLEWEGLPSWAVETPAVQALFERARAHLGDHRAEAALLARPVFRGLDLAEASRRLPY